MARVDTLFVSKKTNVFEFYNVDVFLSISISHTNMRSKPHSKSTLKIMLSLLDSIFAVTKT